MRRALDYSEIITVLVEQLKGDAQKSSCTINSPQTEFLLLLKQNKWMSRAAAGKKLGLLPKGAEKRWKLYCTAGMHSLVGYLFKGRKSYLNSE
jgi:hypothetical protein